MKTEEAVRWTGSSGCNRNPGRSYCLTTIFIPGPHDLLNTDCALSQMNSCKSSDPTARLRRLRGNIVFPACVVAGICKKVFNTQSGRSLLSFPRQRHPVAWEAAYLSTPCHLEIRGINAPLRVFSPSLGLRVSASRRVWTVSDQV